MFDPLMQWLGATGFLPLTIVGGAIVTAVVLFERSGGPIGAYRRPEVL